MKGANGRHLRAFTHLDICPTTGCTRGYNTAGPSGLNELMTCFYCGFAPSALDVPPRWGLFLWLRIRIYWMGRIGRIDFDIWCGCLI